jgi:hypothetical protein
MGIDVEPVSWSPSLDEREEYRRGYDVEEPLVLRWHEFPE